MQQRADWDLPYCNFAELQRVLPYLGHFYILEQILQRDAAHALHLSYCWRRARSLVTLLKLVIGAEDGEEKQEPEVNTRALDTGWQDRDAKMRSSQVFDLFAALWPDPSALSLLEKSSAGAQLTVLIKRSWSGKGYQMQCNSHWNTADLTRSWPGFCCLPMRS